MRSLQSSRLQEEDFLHCAEQHIERERRRGMSGPAEQMLRIVKQNSDGLTSSHTSDTPQPSFLKVLCVRGYASPTLASSSLRRENK